MRKKRLPSITFACCLPIMIGISLSVILAASYTVFAEPVIRTVTTLDEYGSGSLRQTISDANANDIIQFAVTGTISLHSELSIGKNLTIYGNHPITISGNNVTRIFNVYDGAVTFDSLTITNGNISFYDCNAMYLRCGAGIMIQDNNVMVTITNSIISGNSATTGSGIYNGGANNILLVKNSRFSENSSNTGGGIYNKGLLIVENSSFLGNSVGLGAGIYNDTISGTVTVTNSNFSMNSASNSGGGIYNNGKISIDSTNFYSNSASFGGGIQNEEGGILMVTNSSFDENAVDYSGGGIHNFGPNSVVTISQSTLSRGSSNWGGGLSNSGIANVINSTISANLARYGGGGIVTNGAYGTGLLTVASTTISQNDARDGGGIYSYYDGTTDLSNSIVALNSAVTGDDCKGQIWPSINNLDSDGTCRAISTGNPLLGPLANNGGSTRTYALMPGSPAAAAGDCSIGPETDQRGFPRNQDDTCDIGAYEARKSTLTINHDGWGEGIVISTPDGLNCGNICENYYISGTVVTLTAIAEPGSIFAGWSHNDCSEDFNCVLTVTYSETITARFIKFLNFLPFVTNNIN